jgi:hypothetical protein
MSYSYKITDEQLKKLTFLINDIKKHHEVKNEIYKILWSVTDQKLPEITIEMRKVKLDEGEVGNLS